jgi:hypothetical protein
MSDVVTLRQEKLQLWLQSGPVENVARHGTHDVLQISLYISAVYGIFHRNKRIRIEDVSCLPAAPCVFILILALLHREYIYVCVSKANEQAPHVWIPSDVDNSEVVVH